MKVKELIEFLTNCDPEADIVTQRDDHEYGIAYVEKNTYRKYSSILCEDVWLPEHVEPGFGPPTPCVVFS